MAHRYLTWLLVSLVPGLLAFTCLLNGGYASIDSPAPSSTVTTSTVDIQVTVPLASTFDPNTDVTVNGTVVPVTGGLIVWTATLNPGFPLQDINGIRAEVILPSGAPGITQQAFTWLPSKARARKITDPADLIGGPLAHGRIGDYIIENDQARFIIQDVNQRDLYSVGAFGGNLIDAELKANPDNDHFIETTPMLNIETVINADTVDILNDGEDGLPAVIRTCGPDDLLDFVNPSTVVAEAGFTTFPPLADDNDLEISGCTSFTLTPDDTHLLMSTEVFNNQAPGAAIPDLPLWVGDWINPAGQLDNWSKDESGWGLGLNSSFEALSWLGIDTADGSEYAWVGIKDLAISHFNSDYFAESGVFITIHHNSVLAALLGFPPFFVVPEGGSLVYERAFAVGDGTGSAAVQLEADVTGLAVGTVEGCVTVGGVALAGSRVSIGGTVGGIYASLDQSVQTRAGACPNYSAPVPAGSYDATAGRLGTPYEGGAATPPLQPVVVTAGATTSGVDFALPATGQLQVSVTDQASAPLPARVAVVGFDPSPEIINTGASLPGFGAPNFGLLHDVDDGLQFGLVAFGYTDVTGSTTFDVEPGSYQVFVSRGTEWSLFDTPVTISAGAVSNVAAQIAPVLDTAGFVSSDFHVHGIRSADSRIPDGRRVEQFAGEGVENIVMTDHHVHTDLSAEIASLGLGAFVTSTIGEEITTFDYGHFNGYPFTIDASKPSGGSTDWGQAAPVGQDFPSYGNYNATPSEIFTLATLGAQSTPDTTIQVNHINSHFEPLQIDTSVAGAVSDGLDAAERAALRLPVGPNLFQHFPALELWNGMDRGHQSEFLDGRIGVWFNHLNKGLRTTVISDTDTHEYTNLRTAGARSWTASSSDAPGSISPAEVAQAVDAGRVVGGQGIYVQTRLLAQDGSGGIADLTLGGSTDVTSTNGNVDLEIRVQAPTWAAFDTIEIYANAATTPVDPLNPYLFVPAAGSAQVLAEGDCNPVTTGDGDFDLSVVNVHPVSGADRLDTTVVVPFVGLTQDTWFVVLVKGSDGSCSPMFPVFPSDLAAGSNTTLANLLDGNVGESGTMPLGVTNALYADVDGTPGFQPPNP